MDFSFPPGKSVNDGIPKDTYLEFEVEFSLPSVNSMVDRLNELGIGCLLYKRVIIFQMSQSGRGCDSDFVHIFFLVH